MIFSDRPLFIVKENLQKSASTGLYFKDIVTPEVLRDVCNRITGLDYFDYKYVDNNYNDEVVNRGYNKGRLAFLFYQDTVHYISFSEPSIRGRNQSVQSVPTAFNMFYSNPNVKKSLHYYFLHTDGNAETEYHILMYRLMKTAGIHFLNEERLTQPIDCFTSINDIINNRRVNTSKNQSNNSSYITKSSSNQIEIYAKTYGASKYESSFLAYAASKLLEPQQRIKLFEMVENNLKKLPESSRATMVQMGNIEIIPTGRELERDIFNGRMDLRSPRYIYNLLHCLGPKRCFLCGCEIPELVQGAHIWPVASIRNQTSLSEEEKIRCATDGENGIWLCQNHHKLFDESFFSFTEQGVVVYRTTIDNRHLDFINKITTKQQLPTCILTPKFKDYLNKRDMLL